jgi:glutamyl-tRNA reductase
MARRVLAVVACVSSARALVAPAVQPARAAPARTPRAATMTEVETKEALPLSSVVLDEEEERRLKKERRLAAAETSLDVFVVGLSHHNAKVEVREKLAIPQDEWSESAQAIVDDSNGAIAEAAVLSTCNRFEVYFSARDARAAFASISQHFQERSGLPMAELRESLFMLTESDASAHALRVSAGLDSLVVGEGQILSQMKACYANAIEGAGGKVTSRLLNTAVAAGKRARDETDISKGAVSISSAAYELAAERAPLDLAGLELENARVLIVGAGKMTRLLLTHMASHGAVGRKCTILNRSYQRAKDMADEYKEGYDVDIDVVASDGDEQVAYDLAKDADIIFTASSAVDYIFDAENIASLERQAGREKLMLVDIAVPRNVDPDCDQLDDVRAYDVDSLKAVVERNTAKRRREIVEAEKLLEEEQASFRAWITSLGAVPAITKLQTKAEDLRQAELKRADKKLQSLSSREIEAVERLSRGIVSKLLHGPMSSLRGEGSTDDKKNTLSALKKMFGV